MIQLLFSIISQYAVYLSAAAAGTALLIIGKSAQATQKEIIKFILNCV